MKKLQSPARNAAHAENVAAKSMAAVLSVALMLGLTPAQALALAEDDAPTLEQAAPAEEQNGAAAETDTDASAILETSVSDESTDTGAADESEAPAEVSDDETDELASAEEFSRVQGSAASNFKLQSGSTTSIDQYSVSGEAIFSITEGGTYTIRGHRPLTQIKIDADKDEPVVLYLDDVSIENRAHDLSAISIEGDSQVEIHCVNGTQAHLEGGAESSSSSHAGAGIYVNSDAAVTFASDANIVASGGGNDYDGQRAAGIGGAGSGHSDSGQITFENGCYIEAYGATGENGGAGIGSGYDGVCHNITVKGGTIVAKGGNGAAGIGSAAAHGTGNGGDVSGSIQILGGTITATAGDGGAGIGSGQSGDENGGIAVRNATVTATGGAGAAGVGSGDGGDSRGSITISGSSVNATGGFNAAGIGSGYDGVSYDISISGDDTHVVAYGGAWGPGIGAGNAKDLGSGGDQDGTITISGGTIKAHGGYDAPAIGAGGDNGDLNGDVTVSGGDLELVPDGGCAAIGCGGGYNASFNSTITISGGRIWDEGESWIVNDGVSFIFGTSDLASWGDDGYVKITGGTVLLEDSYAGWSAGKPGHLIITGGSVRSLATGAVDSQGRPVYRVALPVADAEAAISSITTNTSYISGQDIYPDENGYVYLYLPATAGTQSENVATLYQDGRTYAYRDNHTTATDNSGSLKMDGTISFKDADGTLAQGDTLELALDDSDASWNGATWTFTADGAAQIADGSTTTSPGAVAKIEAAGTGSYTVTAKLQESRYYWGAEATFTGTSLAPANITLSNLTKRYDGKRISLGNLVKTNSNGRFSFVFEQLKDGAWQKVDPADVVGEGHYRVTATTERTASYAAGTATQEFDILPASTSSTGSNTAGETGTSAAAGTRTASVTTAQAAQKSSLPNTGDETNAAVPAALAALGALAASAALMLRSRKTRD
ncbi:MAG: LPXTG cell wall anchor domain-containing protein [Atopobiaceae bacterium]